MSEMIDLQAVWRLAEWGPSGPRRDPQDLWSRHLQELAELRAAKGQVDILAEAADAWYYLVLWDLNTRRSNRLYAFQMIPILDRLSEIVPDFSPIERYNLVYLATLTKYGVRFIVNQRRKDIEAENEALAHLLRHGEIPSAVWFALRAAGVLGEV